MWFQSPQLGDFKAHVHKLRQINLVKFLLKHYLMSLERAKQSISDSSNFQPTARQIKGSPL